MMYKKLICLASFILMLNLISSNVVSGGIIIESRVSSSTDDREHYVDGAIDAATSSDLEMPYESTGQGSPQVVGMRFLNVNIPPGATITNAYIEFVCDETKGGTEHVSLIIEGEPNPDPPTFTTDIIGRPRTAASVVWEPEDWTSTGQVSQTSDITSIIQEIISLPGWASGNAIVIIISDNPDNPSEGIRCAESVDGSAAQAPLLHIELDTPFASEPSPADGILLEDTWVNLMWAPGMSAVSHDVYFSDNLADVQAGAESAFLGNQASTMLVLGFPGMPYPEGLTPGTTYYWRIDEVEADGTTKYMGAVWSFMVPSKTAYNPSPPDKGKHVDPDVKLSWTPGFGSKLHTVYFGDNFDDVNNATGGAPQPASTYTPGTLEMDKTYYWRVDEFDVVETHKGNVWSFKTLPLITITDPNLIGWWTFDEGTGDTALDFSGYGNDGEFGGDPQWVEGVIGGALNLDGDDYVAIDDVFDDITGTNITLSAWIKTTQGGEGNVFAANSGGSHPLMFGVKGGGEPYVNDGSDVYFPPAINDDQWHMITYVRSGSRGTIYVDGVEVGTYLAVFSLDGVDRWSIGQEWDSSPSDFYVGMVDDARFYNAALTAEQVKELMRGDPLVAWNPNPENNSTVDIKEARKPISWSSGDEATEHDIYFGTDKDAVSNADSSDASGIYQGRQAANSYTLAANAVEWGGGPYYWRIDENNNDGSVSTGAIWNFSVADYLVVDNFESYNDLNVDDPESKRIFYTWLDGYDNPAINGSIVGYANPPFAELNIVHSGRQAMPLFYDNGVGLSEATMTLTDQRNWTEEGVGVLTIWFRGEAANAAVPLYVALNGNAVVTHNNPNATQIVTWTEWNIDLQAFADQGVNLSNVDTISLGLGNKSNPTAGGTGTMYFDDIRLYRPVP